MANKDFNKDLDKYISNRRESGIFPSINSKKNNKKEKFDQKKQEELEMAHHEETVVIPDEKPWWKRIFNFQKEKSPEEETEEFEDELEEELEKEVDEELYELEHEEEQIEKRRGNIIHSFIKKIKFIYGTKKCDSDFTEEVKDEYNNDYSEHHPQKVELYKSRLKQEMKDLLAAMDDLIEHVPKGVKEEFIKTKEYELYKTIFERYNIKSKTAIDEFKLSKK